MHNDQSAAARARRQLAARRFIDEYLNTHACVDCGESERPVLEFDHVGDKRSNVSSLVARAWSTKRLTEEIDVCEVVCVNCHRLRTYRRRSSWRTNPSTLDATSDLLANERRNMIHVRSVLATGQCADCGIRDLRLLEFDHVGPKRGNVIEIARRGCSVALLEDEISQCELRCANCHRRRTRARAAVPDPSVS